MFSICSMLAITTIILAHPSEFKSRQNCIYCMEGAKHSEGLNVETCSFEFYSDSTPTNVNPVIIDFFIPNLYDFCASVEDKRRYFEEFW